MTNVEPFRRLGLTTGNEVRSVVAAIAGDTFTIVAACAVLAATLLVGADRADSHRPA